MITFIHRQNPYSLADRIVWTEDSRGLSLSSLLLDYDPDCTHFLVNGEPAEWGDVPVDGDFVDVVSFPLGPAALVTVGKIVATIAISAAASIIANKLAPQPEAAKDRSDESSPTHGFSRMKNIRAEGQPISVVYGEHRLGGTIINEFVEVNNATIETKYFALISVGEGEVESIAGATVDTPALTPLSSETDDVPTKMFLKGNTLSNFHGVKAWVRLGSNEQDVIPGFERAKTTNTIDVELTAPDVGVGNDLIADYNSDADDDHYDDFGFGYDTTEDVDGVEVVLNFPSGLFLVDDATGLILDSTYKLGIRFARLDGSGNPILGAGNGGNQDDGWVRLPHETITLNRQSPFQLSFPVWLYNPNDFIAGVAGDAVTTNSWTRSQDRYWRTISEVTQANRPDDWSSDGYASEFTIEGWYAFHDTGTGSIFNTGTGNHEMALFEWSSSSGETGNGNGIYIGLSITDGVANDNVINAHVVFGKWSRNLTFPVNLEPTLGRTTVTTPTADDLRWNHFVFTHKRYGSSDNQNNFYVNGVKVGAFVGNYDIITPLNATEGGQARFTFGWSDILDADNEFLAPDRSMRGWQDEVVVLDRFYSAAEVKTRYNGGAGRRMSGAPPNVVAGFHLDTSFVDFGGYSNDAQAVGTGTAIDASMGLVTTESEAVRTRGRYRVQCVRVNGVPQPGGNRQQTTAEWQLAVTWLDEAFSYPGLAYYGIEVEATEQLNTSAPTITAVVKGEKPRIWDQVSTSAPSFTQAWTQNPAWIALDVATNERYGGGQAFDINQDVDMLSVQAFADHCEKRVYDGQGRMAFHRQEYEANANKLGNPIQFDGAAWTISSATVTANVSAAPDGTISADRVEDTSAAAAHAVGQSGLSISTEPQWITGTIYVAKDATSTNFAASIEITGHIGDTMEAIFRVDTGEALQQCSVESYNDLWWKVTIDPVFHEGGIATPAYQLYPSRYDELGVSDVTLQESIEVWGATLSRGRTAVTYPDSEFARAFLYVGDEDASGVTQIIPPEWIVGYELAISSAGNTTWNTDAGLTKSLEITEIETPSNRDGYRSLRVYTCKWPTAQTAPTQTYPNLVLSGTDWDLTDWTESNSNAAVVSDSALFDLPLNSNVAEITAAAAGDYRLTQDLTGLVTDTFVYQFRGLVGFDTTSTDAEVVFSGSILDTVTAANFRGLWTSFEGEQVFSTGNGSVFQIQGDTSAGVGEVIYYDGVSGWLYDDGGGELPGGQVGGAEPLFQYDAVHDTFENLWDDLVNVCLTARAMPVREGRTLRFKVENARPPVGIATLASTLDGSGSSTFRVRYSNTLERANYISIDFHDRYDNWERSAVDHSDPDIETTADAGLQRQEQFFLKGVTRRSQAKRHATFMVNVNKSITREGGFNSGPNALPVEPGDVIAMGHDLMPWGTSGRALHSESIGINLIATDFDTFADWTQSSPGDLLVTSNVVAGPGGEPNGDRLDSLVATEQYISTTVSGIVSGSLYVASVRVKRRDADTFGIRVSQSGGDTILGELDFGAGTFTGPTGTVSSAQEDGGWWRLGVPIDSVNTNDLQVDLIPDRVAPYGTTVYLADAQLEIPETGTTDPSPYDRPGAGLHLDRDVVVSSASGVTTSIRVMSQATGVTSEGTVTTPGSYSRGDVLDVTGLTEPIGEDDEYIIYTDTERFHGIVTSLSLGQDLSTELEWVQYDATIYDADELTDDIVSPPPLGSGQGDSGDDDLFVDGLYGVTCVESPQVGKTGDGNTMLNVSWQVEQSQVGRLAEVRIYTASRAADEPFPRLREVARAAGSVTAASFVVPASRRSEIVTVAVQGVSRGGTRLAPQDCPSTVVVLSGLSPIPEAVANLVVTQEADEVTLTWDHLDPHDGIQYEIRIGGTSASEGGWVMAPVVGVTADNVFGPTTLWASAGRSDVRYMIRAKNRQGVYGLLADAEFSPDIDNATRLISSNWWYSHVTQDWESYVDGWVTDSVPPVNDPVLNNLQRHADGYLEFSGTDLTGTYTTAGLLGSESPGHFELEERLKIEAVVVATCRDPEPIGLGKYNGQNDPRFDVAPHNEQLGWPIAGNETFEGNLVEGGDLPTIKIQVRLMRDQASGAPIVNVGTDSSGSSGWMDYKPGLFQCQGAQFRLRITRPTAAWDVRIYGFSTSFVRDLPVRGYMTPMQESLHREVFDA